MAWTKVAAASELPVGEMTCVMVEGEAVAIYHIEEGFYATSDICTHAGESLTTGRLDGAIIACPKHGGKFDVKTGAPAAFPCVYAVETYPVDVRGDELWIDY